MDLKQMLARIAELEEQLTALTIERDVAAGRAAELAGARGVPEAERAVSEGARAASEGARAVPGGQPAETASAGEASSREASTGEARAGEVAMGEASVAVPATAGTGGEGAGGEGAGGEGAGGEGAGAGEAGAADLAAALAEAQARGLAHLRRALLAEHAGQVVPELVAGDSEEVLLASVDVAKQAYARALDVARATLASQAVPLGAPSARAATATGLTPLEMIESGLRTSGR